jgi:hypothetical protein
MILNESKGSLVEQLQQKFGIAVTGEYDQLTRVAIIGWQLERALPATGAIDESMWIEIFGSLPQVEQKQKVTTKTSTKNDSEVQETQP